MGEPGKARSSGKTPGSGKDPGSGKGGAPQDVKNMPGCKFYERRVYCEHRPGRLDPSPLPLPTPHPVPIQNL
ncbi:hypothetical protein [Streptomyces sp. NPDC088762]|uniref:hypothetical protein n=1 Tax=Streptomyces sp. NPDC088762 TaxID=3365891 RepID=UPI0038113BBE